MANEINPYVNAIDCGTCGNIATVLSGNPISLFGIALGGVASNICTVAIALDVLSLGEKEADRLLRKDWPPSNCPLKEKFVNRGLTVHTK